MPDRCGLVTDRVRLLAIYWFATFLLASPLAAAVGLTRYFYDDGGQLFRALDSTGTLIEYDYDPVGNIVAINRSTVAPSSLAVLNMVPLVTGPGQIITIYGQNFSPNVAGNVVTVSGVVATVISASSTALVVRLGAGTTSGPASVTVNGVTASSGTLQLTATVPTILSTAPDNGLGTRTTTVTVQGLHLNGANFDLPGGGNVINAVINSDTQATLQITGTTPGIWALVASNISGSSDTQATNANRFIVLSEPGGAYTTVSLLNTAWIPADIPSPGNITSSGALSTAVSVLNAAWIPADIPSPGNITSSGALSTAVSVLNAAWIPANIPSPGNLRFAAGLLVSVNNTAPNVAVPSSVGVALTSVRQISGTTSLPTPLDMLAPAEGETIVAGQTLHVRVPVPAARGAEFTVNGIPWRSAAPFDFLFTAPQGVSEISIQAVVRDVEGRMWATPSRHLHVVPDSGRVVRGHVLTQSGAPVSGAEVHLQINGLAAEYFRFDTPLTAFPDLTGRQPDQRGFVSALNQPNPRELFGRDPFGTGFPADYAARFTGRLLATQDGEFRFFIAAHRSARLLIDGRLVTETPFAENETPETVASVSLAAGWHAVEVLHYETVGAASLSLSWQPPYSDREVVPPEALLVDTGLPAITDEQGAFTIGPLPAAFSPRPVVSGAPGDARVVINPTSSEERAHQ